VLKLSTRSYAGRAACPRPGGRGYLRLSGLGRDCPKTVVGRASIENLRSEESPWIGARGLEAFEFDRSSVSRPTTGAPHLEASPGTNPLGSLRVVWESLGRASGVSSRLK